MSNAGAQTAPAGWTQVDELLSGSTTSGVRSIVWTKTATSADLGSTFDVAWDITHAATMVLSAYHGVSTTTGVKTSKVADGATLDHTTPTVTVPGGSWVVSVWSEKSPAANTWTAPSTLTKRADIHTASGTAVSTLVADANAAAAGTVAGSTATTQNNTARAVDWSIVLAPQ